MQDLYSVCSPQIPILFPKNEVYKFVSPVFFGHFYFKITREEIFFAIHAETLSVL